MNLRLLRSQLLDEVMEFLHAIHLERRQVFVHRTVVVLDALLRLAGQVARVGEQLVEALLVGSAAPLALGRANLTPDIDIHLHSPAAQCQIAPLRQVAQHLDIF